MIDLGTLTIVIVASAIGLGSIYISYHIHKKKEESSKVKLDISLMNQSIFDNPDLYEIIYGFSGNPNDIAYCNLQFDILNNGEISAKDIIFTLSCPMNLTPGLEDDNIKAEIQFNADSVKRETAIINNRWVIKYFISSLNPKNIVHIVELVNIVQASTLYVDVPANDKNGVPINFKCELKISTPIIIGISAGDYLPKYKQIIVRTEFVKDLKELENHITWEETQKLRKELSEIGVPEKFVKTAYAPYIYGRAIVIMPELTKVVDQNQTPNSESVYLENYEESKRVVIMPPKNRKSSKKL